MIRKVVHIDNVGKLLEELLDKHRKGEIVGLVIGCLDNERYCQSYWAGLTYLQQVGLAENLKLACVANAETF